MNEIHWPLLRPHRNFYSNFVNTPVSCLLLSHAHFELPKATFNYKLVNLIISVRDIAYFNFPVYFSD